MLIDRNGVTYYDGCEMCGSSEVTPYYVGIGFYCQSCANKEAEHSGKELVKSLWAPHPATRSSRPQST